MLMIRRYMVIALQSVSYTGPTAASVGVHW